jgi:HSP20 family protein
MNAQISRWNPFQEVEDLKLINAAGVIILTENLSKRETVATAQWTPRVDISEDDQEFLIKMELPAMTENNVKITVADGALTISGERVFDQYENHVTYHRIESEHGTFTRSFALPQGTSGDRVSTGFRDGVLSIRLPKDGRAPPLEQITALHYPHLFHSLV